MTLNFAFASMPAELKALLLLSGMRPLSGAGETLAEVVAAGSAERFMWLVNEHGVAGFVQKNIAETGLREVLPPTLYQGLRNQSFRSIARNSFIMTSLRDAAKVLSCAEIIPVLLKGTALELSVYRESGLRPMSDADILLPHNKCMKAWRVLQAAGFKPLPFKSPLHRLIPLHVGKHLPSLVKGGFLVEIHHGLFWGKGERVTSEMIEQGTGLRAQSAEQGAESAGRRAQGSEQWVNVKIPPAGLHFLYLLSHLVQHEKDGNSQLRQYNDLVAMIDFHGAEEVVGVAFEHSAEVGLEEELRNKLGLLRVFMGVELPEKYHYEPSASAVDLFISFLGNPKGNPVGDSRVIYRETVRGIPGLHRKLIFVIGDIFPGFRFMKERYWKNSVWGVLPYYFLRIGKVLWLVKKGVKGVQGRRRA